MEKEVFFAATWMELETLILSKSKRERQIVHDITYVEYKIWHKRTYLQKRNKLVDMENRLVVAKGQGEGVEWNGSWG